MAFHIGGTKGKENCSRHGGTRRSGSRDEEISADGHVDEDGILSPRPLIVFGQQAPQPTGIDAHDRIADGVEIRRQVQRFDPDDKLIGLLPCQRLLHHKPENPGMFGCRRKIRRRQDLIELLPNRLGSGRGRRLRSAGSCGRQSRSRLVQPALRGRALSV